MKRPAIAGVHQHVYWSTALLVHTIAPQHRLDARAAIGIHCAAVNPVCLQCPCQQYLHGTALSCPVNSRMHAGDPAVLCLHVLLVPAGCAGQGVGLS
jgi:hypothetical protein